MKNRWIIAALFLLSLLFYGCSREEVTLTLDFPEDYDFSPEELKSTKEIFALFEKRYPHIKLEFKRVFYRMSFHSSPQSRPELIPENIMDIIFYYPGYNRGRELRKRELIADLTPYIDKKFRKNYLPAALEPDEESGGLYHVPTSISLGPILYVNRAVLDELNLKLPERFTELEKMLPVIKAGGYEPLLMANSRYSSWVMAEMLLYPMMERLSLERGLKRADQEKSFLERAEIIDALKMIREFYRSGLLTESSFELEYGEAARQFNYRKAPFMIDFDWRITELTELMTKQQLEKIELHPLPLFPGQSSSLRTVSIWRGSGLAMKRGLPPEKAEAAWKLISFFSGKEAAELRLKLTGTVPLYKLKTKGYELTLLQRKLINFSRQVESDNGNIRNSVDVYMFNRLTDELPRMVRGEIEPEELLMELAKDELQQ